MAEHDLITNHQVLAPEDTLTKTWPGDTEELALSRAMHGIDVKKRLLSLDSIDLDEVSFSEPGKIVIDLMVNGELTPVEFKIKAISDSTMRELAKPLTRLNSKWPTKWDSESKTRIHNEEHPDYDKIADQFFATNREYEFKKLLHGLNMTLRYNGRVLWNPNKKEEQDFEASVARLDAMDIRISDIKLIVQAIDRLSDKRIKDDQEEFSKK